MGKHRWPIVADTRAPDALGVAGAGGGTRRGALKDLIDRDAAHADVSDRELDDHSRDPSAGILARRRKSARSGPRGRDSIQVDGPGYPFDQAIDEDDDADYDPGFRDGAGSGTYDSHDRPTQPAIRWGIARSAALVFLGVALAVGAALFLVRSSEPSAASVSVQLGADTGDGAPADEPRASEQQAGPGRDTEGTTGVTDGDGAPASPAGAAGTSAPGTDPPASRGAGSSEPGTIVVYVTGAVVAPGVVTVPAGTRLFEILEQLGGTTEQADLEGINLAGLPSDGEHLHVLAVGEAPRPPAEPAGQESPAVPSVGAGDGPPGSAADAVQPDSMIDINTATLAEIESLPRVGPVLGQRIIEWRDVNGPFARPADIDAVPGIGPAMLEGILPLITTR